MNKIILNLFKTHQFKTHNFFICNKLNDLEHNIKYVTFENECFFYYLHLNKIKSDYLLKKIHQ